MSVISQAQPPPYQVAQVISMVTGTTHPDDRDDHVIIVEQTEEDLAAIEHHKQNIYKHPLFPLMALLFEKCEQATQTSDFPSSESFDADIQAFLQHRRKENKPVFSDDMELDNLMVRSIQVLRIHLLEMEKVTDLCKDFCTRYIGCLKGKLQNEQLLKVEAYDDEDDLCPLSPPSQNQSQVQGQQVMAQVVNGNMVIQQSVQPSALSMATISQGQIVSGNTVYQMVQTPQGIVAQPIQIQTTPMASPISNQVLHGSSALSQMNVVNSPVITQHIQHTVPAPTPQNPATPNSSFFDDDDPTGKRKNKRGVLPKQATQVMKSWLFQHIVHPYPTEDEKKTIAGQTNLTLLQVNNWFINARRRILQPMMDTGNPEQAKAKKKQTPTQPKQRFWPESIANIQPQLLTSESEEIIKQEADTAIQPAPTTLSMVTANGQIFSTSATGITLETLQPSSISAATLTATTYAQPLSSDNSDSDLNS